MTEFNEVLWKLAGGLAVITALLFIVTNTFLRKKVLDKRHLKTGKEVVVKVGKDAWKNRPFQKFNSKKPQLPKGNSQVNTAYPLVSTPDKIPKQSGIIPLQNFSDPSFGFGNVEIKYFDGCNGYTLFETGPNGESLAFECVAGYDEKKDKYTIWFYKVKYHKDARKKAENNNDYDLYERVN